MAKAIQIKLKAFKGMKVPPFYKPNEILKTNADYYQIIGERSNGKTHAILMIILFGFHVDGIEINGYLDNGTQGGIIRRMMEDFKGKFGSQQFEGIIHNTYYGNILEQKTNGKWNSILYYSGKWYLQLVDEDGKVLERDENPFCFAFSLSSTEHYKSISYPNIRILLFDEFLTRGYYLPDEFILLTSIISTVVRLRDDLKIFMCANTVNKYSPYFKEMGISNIKKQQKGTIDVYTYGESTLKVAVELCGDLEFQKSKASNKYFAFNNPKLNMIKTGEWELNIYPHLPHKYERNNILYKYYIVFEEDILQCNIIAVDNIVFTYIHRKTTPIKDDGKSIVYSQVSDARRNYRRKITKPVTKVEKMISKFYVKDKVFYQDNEVGEIVRNYFMWCKTSE